MGRREERPENQPVTVPGPGGFVNQFREAADVGGLARDLPRSGGRECSARAERGRNDQAARQAEREASTEGRHYFTQRAASYSRAAEGPLQGGAASRRGCAMRLLCDVIASRVRAPKGEAGRPRASPAQRAADVCRSEVVGRARRQSLAPRALARLVLCIRTRRDRAGQRSLQAGTLQENTD